MVHLYETVANGGYPNRRLDIPLAGEGDETATSIHVLMGVGTPKKSCDLLDSYDGPLEWVDFGIPLAYDESGNVTLFMLYGDRVGQIWHLIMHGIPGEPAEIYFVAKDMDEFIAMLTERSAGPPV